MKITHLFYSIIIFITTNTIAVCQDNICYQKNDNSTSSLEWSISYFSRTITHPGLKVSLSNDIMKNIKSNCFHFSVQSSLGFYYHRSNQTALFSTLNFVPLLNIGKEMKWDLSVPIGIGYMRTFLDGKIYTVDKNDNVSRLHFVGNNYLMSSLGFSVGREIQHTLFSRLFITLGAFGQYPYNSYMLPNLYFEIGLVWK